MSIFGEGIQLIGYGQEFKKSHCFQGLYTHLQS